MRTRSTMWISSSWQQSTKLESIRNNKGITIKMRYWLRPRLRRATCISHRLWVRNIPCSLIKIHHSHSCRLKKQLLLRNMSLRRRSKCKIKNEKRRFSKLIIPTRNRNREKLPKNSFHVMIIDGVLRSIRLRWVINNSRHHKRLAYQCKSSLPYRKGTHWSSRQFIKKWNL